MNKYEKKYYHDLLHRYDNHDITFRYYGLDYYQGLLVKSFHFNTIEHHMLKGYIYNYAQYNNQSLIIFAHGISDGHKAYMEEINILCQAGYQVLAYDVVGCESSHGRRLYAVGEFANDLDQVIDWINNNPKYNNRELILIGHSCGGFAVGCCINKTNKIKKAIMLAPFNKIENFIRTIYQEDEKMVAACNKIESSVYPFYASKDNTDELKNTNVKTLIIQSHDDHIVNYQYGLGLYQSKINNSHISYLELNNKKHSPSYTLEAVQLLDNFLINLNQYESIDDKKAYVDKIYIHDVTKQDMDVWKEIINFIK